MASTKPNKKPKIPSSPAQCADLLYETRQERLEIQRQVEKLESLESALKDFFINKLDKNSTGIAGRVARVQIQPKSIPIAENWPKFYKYVQKTGAFDLMQKRLAEGAVKERWDNGVQLPGIGRMQVKTVSCTVIKKGK